MTRTPIYVTLLTAALATPAAAQLQAFGGDAPRMASTQILWNNGPVGMICIQYGQPEWKDEYDNMLDQAKGKRFRLGKDFWTTFNTSTALTIADTKVQAGSYYLGIGCTDEGDFELLVLNAEQADKKGYAPFTPENWKPDYTCTMKKGESDDTQKKLSISLQGSEDDPTQMTLQIAWGDHALTAPVEVHIGAAKDAAADKGKK